MKNTNPKKAAQHNNTNKSNYLEIFIAEDGKMIFTHLNSYTLPIFNKIACNKRISPNIYCG